MFFFLAKPIRKEKKRIEEALLITTFCTIDLGLFANIKNLF